MFNAFCIFRELCALFKNENLFSPGAIIIQKSGLEKGGLSSSNRGAIRGLWSNLQVLPKSLLTAYVNWTGHQALVLNPALGGAAFSSNPKSLRALVRSKEKCLQRACLKEHWIRQNLLHHSIYLICWLFYLTRLGFLHLKNEGFWLVDRKTLQFWTAEILYSGLSWFIQIWKWELATNFKS